MISRTTALKLRNRGAVTVTSLSMVLLQPQSVLAQTPSQIGEGVDQATPDTEQRGLFADGGIFERIVNILLFLVGALSVIMLIIGGIRYVVSGGDQNAVTGAKNTILYAIIGIVVAFLAWGAVNFILNQLNEGTT